MKMSDSDIFATQELSEDLGIAEALNEAYSREAENDAYLPWYPRPSALGGCLREIALRLAGRALTAPRSPESMRILELGKQRGEELERRCKPIWPDAETQLEVQVPVPWGAMPGTVDLWIPSKRTIVDFKTAGAYTMGLLLAGEKEDEGYALQLNAYRWGIQNRVSLGGLDDCCPPISSIRTVLVYEAKDSDARKGVEAGMLVEQEILYTPELEARYQTRLQELAALLAAHAQGTLDPLTVPGMPHDAKGNPHWRCRMKDGKPRYCSIGPIQGQCS